MDLLSDVLTTLRLTGTLYFRTAFTAPWGVQVPAFENVSRFHFAHRGRCYARVAGVDTPVLLEQGDLIIITKGASHVLCDPVDQSAASLDDVVSQSKFTGEGALVYGDGGGEKHETQLICGHFAFDQDASHPLIDALPRYLHLRHEEDIPHAWLDSTLNMIAAETGRGQLGGDLVALKLSEIILAQAIRSHLKIVNDDDLVLAAFADANICKALTALHGDPGMAWKVEDLARVAGLSRTVFATRFHRLMGMTPLVYLTHWRMQQARRLLVDTSAPIIDIAEKSGYQSEASFSRVFKHHFDLPPAGYRRARSAAAGFAS